MKTTPCVGCGHCCIKVMCAMGVVRYGLKELCPALIWKNGRHWCQLVLDSPPSNEHEFPYIGAGCSSTLFNDWRTNLKDRTGG